MTSSSSGEQDETELFSSDVSVGDSSQGNVALLGGGRRMQNVRVKD